MQALCSITVNFKRSQGKASLLYFFIIFDLMKKIHSSRYRYQNYQLSQWHFRHESQNIHGQANFLYTQSPFPTQKDFHHLRVKIGRAGIPCIKANGYTWLQRNTSQGRTAYPWQTKPDPTGLISSLTTISAEFSWLFKGKTSLKLQHPHMSFQLQHNINTWSPAGLGAVPELIDMACITTPLSASSLLLCMGLLVQPWQCAAGVPLHKGLLEGKTAEVRGRSLSRWIKAWTDCLMDVKRGLEGWQNVGYNN